MPLPDWLLWLLPVPLATLAAIAWASWTSRARGPQRPEDSVQEFDRFRAAMARPAVGGSQPGAPRPGSDDEPPDAGRS